MTATLAYVKKVEGTIRFYGEGESAVLDRIKTDGTSLLDAFVAQEQIVLRWNSENPGQQAGGDLPGGRHPVGRPSPGAARALC